MNHNFSPSQINKLLCATCHLIEELHSKSATCEACGNELHELLTEPNGKKLLLCQSCFDKEKELIQQEQSKPKTIEYELTPAEKMEKYAEQLRAELPLNAQKYHVSKITAIIDIERKILSDDSIPNEQLKYEKLAQLMTERQIYLKKVLFEVIELGNETRSEIFAIGQYFNQIASKLRKEIQEKYKIVSPEYKPSEPKIKLTNKVRSVEGIELPKIEGITLTTIRSVAKLKNISLEEAHRQILSMQTNAKKSLGKTCTCDSTPGICELHSN